LRPVSSRISAIRSSRLPVCQIFAIAIALSRAHATVFAHTGRVVLVKNSSAVWPSWPFVPIR
jgi:hypothetical protein